MSTDWNSTRMLELGRLHARLEAERKLEPLLGTLVSEPVYEFYPLAKRMAGGEQVRRYYRQFLESFMAKVVGSELLEEWVNEGSVAQEYDITVDVDGAHETHRVLGVLHASGNLLGGERIYGSERVIRLMLGEMFDELKPLNST